ncbi:MAG TPA: 6-phosphogluconolactonase, partial [Solirubrobacteraceae bacterium]|nr:6-phosphogluconolactonase [Solirubrobacteraceae bacterium]
MTSLTTCADAEAASQRAAAEIERRLRAALRERGTAHLALSGGGTPARTYELLREEIESWKQIHVWFADERCVAPDDDESNYKLARETLLDGAAELDPATVHRMAGELGPERGAERYAEALREHAPLHDGLAVLDVIVLGIGPDG